MARQIVLVIDLDETLIHTYEHSDPELLYPTSLDVRDRLYVLDFYDAHIDQQIHFVGVRRPHLDYFLREVRNLVDKLVVYTAAETDYAHQVVNAIFTARGIPPPDYIFSRSSCAILGEELTKPLVGILELEPELARVTDLNHMIMLDDRETNFLFNKENGLLIPAYTPEPTIQAILLDEDRYLLAALVQIRQRVDRMRMRDAKKAEGLLY